MKDKKVLYVSSELVPYLDENEVSMSSFNISKTINDIGGQIRIFMPCYGHINERRHQLHEVIRLSGMNLVVNDVDMPLVIKVASIPKERIQVYFIDNDEYFNRKAVYQDDDGKLFEDNDERAIFFAKGVVETIKKLNWVPDIIHVHGWLSSLLPMYMKHYYSNDKFFSDTKIVTSVYGETFNGTLSMDLKEKLMFDRIPSDAISVFENPICENVIKAAIENSDAVVFGSDAVSDNIKQFIENVGKPFLPFVEKEDFAQKYIDFYKNYVL
ncbi:MAG: glycogen/starch synthase [Bacteroidota bacterium]|nr:glycogen/starch synthase [Bacteroidota bacterium]